MRRILLFVAAAALLTACGEKEPKPTPDLIYPDTRNNYITFNGETRAINYTAVYEDYPSSLLVFSSKPFGTTIFGNNDYLIIEFPMELNGQTLNLADARDNNYSMRIMHVNGLFSDIDILPAESATTGTYYINKSINLGGVWLVDLVGVTAGIGSITAHFEGRITTFLGSLLPLYPNPYAFTSAVAMGNGDSYSLPNGRAWVNNFDNGNNAATTISLICSGGNNSCDIYMTIYHEKGTVLSSGTYFYSASKNNGTFGNTYVEAHYPQMSAFGTITGGNITISLEARTLRFNYCTISKPALGGINGELTF